MSLTTWHPPPVTHIGFPSHTSNGDYGKWSHLNNSHYSPVTLTTPSSPWLNRKSSGNYDGDIFSSTGSLSYARQSETPSNVTNITFTDKTLYPSTSEARIKSLLSDNNNNNHKNDIKTVLYTYTDPTSNNHKTSTSSYSPELYSSESTPSYKPNFTTTVKTTVPSWSHNSYSKNGLDHQPQKESGSPSWRSVKPTTTSGLTATAYVNVTEPSTTTRGYELYSDSSRNNRPTSSISNGLYSSSTTSKSQPLQRSNSFHGPSSSSNNTIDSKVISYGPPVSSRTVKDKLESWGNDRQNASVANSLMPYTLRDSHLNSTGRDPGYSVSGGHTHVSVRSASDPTDTLNSSSSSSSRHDLYGGTKPHTYESYNHGLGIARQNPSISHGYGTLDSSTSHLQHKLDELHLGNNLASPTATSSSSSSLATKLRTPESPRSLLVPLSPRNSRKQHQTDWDRYLNGDRSATAPSGSEIISNLQSNDPFTVDHRFRSAPARKPKSILKKKSAYETVSGGENWRSYFQESEFSGYGLYRQNTMPNMRVSSRAPLPQLGKKSTGRRVHFAM